jgi:putative SOS response-associated peptidase YedK
MLTGSARSPVYGGAIEVGSRRVGPVVELDIYAFMTTMPNALVATVNHERMLVLLTRPEEFDMWMHGSPEAGDGAGPGVSGRTRCRS